MSTRLRRRYPDAWELVAAAALGFLTGATLGVMW